MDNQSNLTLKGAAISSAVSRARKRAPIIRPAPTDFKMKLWDKPRKKGSTKSIQYFVPHAVLTEKGWETASRDPKTRETVGGTSINHAVLPNGDIFLYENKNPVTTRQRLWPENRYHARLNVNRGDPSLVGRYADMDETAETSVEYKLCEIDGIEGVLLKASKINFSAPRKRSAG